MPSDVRQVSTQFTSAAASTTNAFECHDSETDDGGILEVHEALTAGVGLELQLVRRENGAIKAGWVTDRGAWLGCAVVGRSRTRYPRNEDPGS